MHLLNLGDKIRRQVTGGGGGGNYDLPTFSVLTPQ